MDELDIAGLIARIKQEICAAEKQAAGGRKMFMLEQLELELKFVVAKSGGGRAGFKFLAVSADGEAKYAKETVQSVKLLFKALGEDSAAASRGGKKKGSVLGDRGRLGPVLLKPVVMRRRG